MAALLLTACSSSHKKIDIFLKGSAAIDKDNRVVTLKDGLGSTQETIDFTVASAVTLKVVKADGSMVSFDFPDNGYYVINAKNDTTIGGMEHFGTTQTVKDTIRQVMIMQSIDSLQQMVDNKNISAANHSFFILPWKSAKITNNPDATIIAPFHQLHSIQGDKEPEVYRFYSIQEMRQRIADRKELTIAPKS